MDFILNTIERKIKRFAGRAEAKIYYQVKVEYSFYLLLAYFWNKNFEQIGLDDFVLQGNIIREIQRPSIGTIGSLIQKLDINKEIAKSSGKDQENQELSAYAKLRNDVIGHGYSFEDNLQKYSSAFESWFQNLLNLRVPILNRKTDLIICEGFDSITKNFYGTLYDYDGDIHSNWKCSNEVGEFIVGNVYASFEANIYFRLSPFIHIDTDDDGQYVYRSIEQALIGKIQYNRIDKSDYDFTICWKEFEFNANNGLLRKHPNGCLMNIFTPNFKSYIEVGSIKTKVYDFLIGRERNSSVCITLWGHGGNGKTATVQKITEELALREEKVFEYIFFLSAKDRELNKYSGKIVPISNENRITSFDELLEKLNLLLFNSKSTETSKIVESKSKILFVIDDYETFEDIDKEKITKFIKLLNLNFHKVIITTRNSFLKIGDDIQTNELDANNTIKFLLEVLKNEQNYSQLQLKDVEKEINSGDTKEEIHKITLGKPIEIIRFINCFIQKGRLSADFLREMKKINSRSERIEFFYGRNYSQLSGDSLAQDIFVVIGLLTPTETLTSLLKHIKLILNKKEEDESAFNSAVDKLVKLRLIDIDEDETYKVDSKDILEIMKKEYDKRDNSFRSGTKAIYDRIKSNITSDTDKALLTHAKSLRHQSNPDTVIQQYREILKQGKDFSYRVKLEALLDLTDFMFNHRGDKESAIKTYDEYFTNFNEFEVLKRYTSYTWSLNKEKSIKILEEYFHNESYNHGINRKHKLHLLGLIVMRECFYWNDRYENEIHNRGMIKEEMQRIFNNFGHLLVAQLKNPSVVKNFSSEEVNDVVLALEGLIDICYRIKNKAYATQVCKLGISNFPERYQVRFVKKLDKLNGFRTIYNRSNPRKENAISKEVPVALNDIQIVNLELQRSGYKGQILKVYLNDTTKYGYIKIEVEDSIGRVYFRESSLISQRMENLKQGDLVEFGFGKITPYKLGAINVLKV